MKTTIGTSPAELLEELRQLACLLAGRGDIEVVEGEADSGWSFNHVTETISMDPRRLRTESPDFNRGLVLHEGAHAAITRLHWFARDPFFRRQDVFSVLNAVEDCRIETWLMERFPGSRPWIRGYNDKLLRADCAAQAVGEMPPLFSLGWVIVTTWWHGRDALQLPAELAGLRDEVWPAVEAICRAIPCGKTSAQAIEQRYSKEAVGGTFWTADAMDSPGPWEQEVRLCQADMWEQFKAVITPVLRRIAPPLRPAKLPPHLQPLFERWLRQAHWGPPAQRTGPSRNSLSQRLRHRFIPSTGGGGEDDANPAWSPDLAAYERMRRGHAGVIERVGDELLRRLQPATRRSWAGPFTTGARLCLRSAVRAESNPRLGEHVWERHHACSRPDPLFVLLVDRSGSMAGERLQATAEAATLLAEVCARCGLALSIFTFSNGCTPLIGWTDPLDDRTRGLLGGLREAGQGGTELAAALKVVREHLAQAGFTDRFLVILSDGRPDSPEATGRTLRQLTDEGVSIIGLGVGDDTAELAKVVPGARTGLTPAQIPGAFLQLLSRVGRHRVGG